VSAVTRLLAALVVVLSLSACGGGDEDAVPAPPAEQACTAEGARQTVRHVLAALEDGDLDSLDEAFAQPPVFRWYSSEAPGERLDDAATDRATLRSYFERRSKAGESMNLTSFQFRGAAGGYAQFEYGVTRTADDLDPTPFVGRGAISCNAQRGKLAAWSLAHT
jgi:hypothetical protein